MRVHIRSHSRSMKSRDQYRSPAMGSPRSRALVPPSNASGSRLGFDIAFIEILANLNREKLVLNLARQSHEALFPGLGNRAPVHGLVRLSHGLVNSIIEQPMRCDRCSGRVRQRLSTVRDRSRMSIQSRLLDMSGYGQVVSI